MRVDAGSLEGRHVLVVPVRQSEDIASARYTVQAAVSRKGAVVIVDALNLDDSVREEARAFVADMARTTAGNGQRLAVLARPELLVDLGLERHASLEAALREADVVSGRQHAVTLTLPARIETLAPVRTHLAGIVRGLHGEADGFQVELLVDELALNAIENSPSERNWYDVSFACENHELRLEVTNVFDESIDSARIMHKRLASFDDSGTYLGERGRGLFLIARLADGLQIRPMEPDRLCVIVTKKLRGEPPGAVDGA